MSQAKVNIQHAFFKSFKANIFHSGQRVTVKGAGYATVLRADCERGYTVKFDKNGAVGGGWWDHDLKLGLDPAFAVFNNFAIR